MLLRAFILRQHIAEWIRGEEDNQFKSLRLTKFEWDQVRFLIKLLAPFKKWTEAISRTRGATIHKAWFLYNLILGHIMRLQMTVEKSEFGWKTELLEALEAGRLKLLQYRGKATGSEGLIYGIATVIDPATRLGQFQVCDSVLAW